MRTNPIVRRLYKVAKDKLGIRVVDYAPLPAEHDPIRHIKRQAKGKDPDLLELHLRQLLEESFSYQDDVSGLRTAKDRMQYLLTCYELFKMVAGIPGHIVEVGVWRGLTAMLFGHFIELFNQQSVRQYFGFDTFEGFTAEDLVGEADTVPLADRFLSTSYEFVNALAQRQGYRHMHFVKGDVKNTLPSFLEERADFKVALLYIDCDVYLPTKATLELLIGRMQTGGVIAFDEYNHWPEMQGETRAADEILRQHGLRLQVLGPPSNISAYCRVD